MAAQSRTLKLSILGDVDQLKRSLNTGTKEVQSFGSKVSDFGKKAGLAFAAAGAAAALYAGKLAIDGVNAAIADEKANALLANTLRNVAGATDETIKKVLEYTRSTELATGVTEDELRPSLNRLVIATGDVQKAMALQTLALDVSAGSGKSLEAVTQALAKAQEGNTTSLGRLGVGLTAVQLKTMSMQEVTASLARTFEGASATSAETFEVKMKRLGLAFEDVRDTVGGFILDTITPMVTLFMSKVVPALESVAAAVGPQLTPVFKALGDYFTNVLLPAFTTLYNFIRDYIVPILNVTLIPIIKALANAWTTIANALKENSNELEPLRAAFYAFAGFLRDTVAPIIGTFITGAIGGIAGVVAALIGVVGDVTSAVTSGFNKVKNFFSNVVNFISDTADDLVSPIVRVFKAAINTIIGLWNRLDFAITFTVPDWVPIIGGNRWSSGDIFPDIPMLAKGGIVNSPTLAMIGEAGPEAVIPLNKSGLMGNNINVTVNGAIDPESTARQIITILNNSSYRGTLGAGAFAS